MRRKLSLYSETAIQGIVDTYPSYSVFLERQTGGRIYDLQSYYIVFSKRVLERNWLVSEKDLNTIFRILTECLLTMYPYRTPWNLKSLDILMCALINELSTNKLVDALLLDGDFLTEVCALGIDIYEMFKTNNSLTISKLKTLTPIMWLGVSSSTTLILGVAYDINTNPPVPVGNS